MNDWKKNNSNLGMVQAGSADVDRAGFSVGSKTGSPTFHSYESVRKAFMTNSSDYISTFDDFLGGTIDGKWITSNVSSGTTIAIAASQEGKAVLSADAVINHFANLTLGLHFLVSKGYTFFETRVKNQTAITARILEIGFSDALTETAGLAFSNQVTPTAVADNAAIFGYSTANSMTTWSANTVKATVAKKTLLSAAPSTSYVKLGLIIDPNGAAHYFVNGVRVLDVLNAVATTAVLTPWITIKTTAGTAALLDVDYVFVGGTR